MYDILYSEYSKNPVWYKNFSEDILQNSILVLLDKYPSVKTPNELLKLCYTIMWQLKRCDKKTEATRAKLFSENIDIIEENFYSQSSDVENLELEDAEVELLFQKMSIDLSVEHVDIFKLVIHPDLNQAKTAKLLGVSTKKVFNFMKEVRMYLHQNYGIDKSSVIQITKRRKILKRIPKS
jgi:DNA-directed RNA polymerase specialized sigma24 family protein